MTLLLMQCFVMLHVSHGVINVGTILLTDEQLVYVLEAVQGIRPEYCTAVAYQESDFIPRFDFSACMSLFTVH